MAGWARVNFSPGAALRLLLPAGYPSCEPPVPVFDCEGRSLQRTLSELKMSFSLKYVLVGSELLRQTLASAICELTDSWEPRLDGEGCIYQRLGQQRRGFAGNEAKVHGRNVCKKWQNVIEIIDQHAGYKERRQK